MKRNRTISSSTNGSCVSTCTVPAVTKRDKGRKKYDNSSEDLIYRMFLPTLTVFFFVTALFFYIFTSKSDISNPNNPVSASINLVATSNKPNFIPNKINSDLTPNKLNSDSTPNKLNSNTKPNKLNSNPKPNKLNSNPKPNKLNSNPKPNKPDLKTEKKEKKYEPRFDEMPGAGDKSKKYRELREEFDALFPRESVKARSELVKSLHKNKYEPMKTDIGYDIYNCPLYPPDNYPYTFNLVDDILANWPADDTEPRGKIFNSLCVFDYEYEVEKAMNYRDAELPFVIRNDPNVHRTVERWNHSDYLKRLLGDNEYRAEYSANNHFMYWSHGKITREIEKKLQEGSVRVGHKIVPKHWRDPTKIIQMKYQDWLDKANVSDESKLNIDMPHWYFRLISCGLQDDMDCDKKGNKAEFIFDELSFFQPKDSIYFADHTQQTGIHCRFGMKGVIAENHYDGSRNMVALLGGERRYVLNHPDQCHLLALLPPKHPSGRHSAIDWSNPDLDTYPEFKKAMGNEVVMQAGDVLYLPTDWFHYIISLNTNYQCNTRSGWTDFYKESLEQCGFK